MVDEVIGVVAPLVRLGLVALAGVGLACWAWHAYGKFCQVCDDLSRCRGYLKGIEQDGFAIRESLESQERPAPGPAGRSDLAVEVPSSPVAFDLGAFKVPA